MHHIHIFGIDGVFADAPNALVLMLQWAMLAKVFNEVERTLSAILR